MLTLSSFWAQPRQGHLGRARRTCAYLWRFSDFKIRVREEAKDLLCWSTSTAEIATSGDRIFSSQYLSWGDHWSYCYHKSKLCIGFEIIIYIFKDQNLIVTVLKLMESDNILKNNCTKRLLYNSNWILCQKILTLASRSGKGTSAVTALTNCAQLFGR